MEIIQIFTALLATSIRRKLILIEEKKPKVQNEISIGKNHESVDDIGTQDLCELNYIQQ